MTYQLGLKIWYRLLLYTWFACFVLYENMSPVSFLSYYVWKFTFFLKFLGKWGWAIWFRWCTCCWISPTFHGRYVFGRSVDILQFKQLAFLLKLMKWVSCYTAISFFLSFISFLLWSMQPKRDYRSSSLQWLCLLLCLLKFEGTIFSSFGWHKGILTSHLMLFALYIKN